MEEVTVTIRWSEERVTELWRNIMGGAFEVNPWWVGVKYLLDAEWDVPGPVILYIANPDDGEDAEEEFRTITPENVVNALYKAMDKGYVDACTGTPIHENMDWDSCSSDVILQIAVLGDVVYG